MCRRFATAVAWAVAAKYTENATMPPPGMDIQKGRAAIEKTVAGLGGTGIRNFALTAVDVSQVGPDTAREIGRFSLDAPAPKKKWVKADGKYAVVWKLVAGEWLLDVDLWNLNKSPRCLTSQARPRIPRAFDRLDRAHSHESS
jgi:ketosteroid isomerase-like protein